MGSNPIISANMVTSNTETDKERINQFLRKLLADKYPTNDAKTKNLAEAMAYSLLNGGKRVRPLITLAICKLYNQNSDQALELACTAELIHTASIMLDDLPSMDNAKYRRGKPASHVIFGEATTILASMALWSEALMILTNIESAEMNNIIRNTAGSIGRKGLVLGQVLDLESFNKQQTIEDLRECHYFKTAVLFKNAAKMGGLFCKVPEAELNILEKFGQDFGLMYQIRDDILGMESTTERIGKDASLDERNGRVTFVGLLGIEGARNEMKRIIKMIYEDLGQLPFDVEVLNSLVRELKIS